MPRYVPRKGDFVALTLDPQAGHEQRERRPALVMSNDLFNRHTGLCMVCPVTSTRRDYPFHVAIPEGQEISGFVMVEQLESIDFRARRARKIAKASPEVLEEALSILDACVY